MANHSSTLARKIPWTEEPGEWWGWGGGAKSPWFTKSQVRLRDFQSLTSNKRDILRPEG